MRVKSPSTKKLGHKGVKPVPLIMLERAITLKWRIGLTHTSGCSQLRYSLGRRHRARRRGEQGIDEEAGELRLLRGP